MMLWINQSIFWVTQLKLKPFASFIVVFCLNGRNPIELLGSQSLGKSHQQADVRSFYRLQQTCRDVKDFIDKSSKISVRFDANCHVELDKESWKCFVWSYPGLKTNKKCIIRPENLYKLRFNAFYVHYKVDRTADRLLDSLKNNYITCNDLKWVPGRVSKTQYAQMLKILKPIKATLCYNIPVYVPILQRSAVKSLHVNAKRMSIEVVPELLTKFHEIDINMPKTSGCLHLFRTVLEGLFAQPLPNLQVFNLVVDADRWELPSIDEIEERLSDYKLIIKGVRCEDDVLEKVIATVDLSSFLHYFPSGAVCKITLSRHSRITIEFKRTPNKDTEIE